MNYELLSNLYKEEAEKNKNDALIPNFAIVK